MSRNCIYHLYKTVPINEKRPRRPEIDGFEEMEPEFPFGTFLLEKQDYLFKCSVAPGGNIFRWSDPKSREFRLLYNQIFRKYLCKKTGEYIKTGQAYRLTFLHSAELAVAGGPSFQFHMYRSRTQMDRFGCQRASLRDLVGRKLSKWSYR